MTKYTYTNKYKYPKFLTDYLYCAKVFKVTYEQKTYFFTLVVVKNFAFFTNSFFLSFDDASLNSSFVLRFMEGIMRPYHSSNQQKKLQEIIYNERAALLFSTIGKKFLTFHETNNYKNGKNNSYAVFILNETQIFRSEYSFLIYTEK